MGRMFRIAAAVLIFVGLGCGFALGQVAQARPVQVCVVDASGAAIADAAVFLGAGTVAQGKTDATGCASVVAAAGMRVRVERRLFLPGVQVVGDAGTLRFQLKVAPIIDTVEITATRSPLGLDASASSVRLMSGTQLNEAPGLSLDDKLRQVAGFQLFRRTGSWVSNPTSQGTSLRGLGSTAASRTLVLSDQVPLNDAFGGWVHWNEIPQMAVRDVELMRGGASDLYGSSAIGGVIDVVPVMPKEFGYGLDLAGATLDTSSVSGVGTAAVRGWSGLAAATLFRTGGFVLTDPSIRGAVDVPSNVHSQSGRVEVRRSIGTDSGVFLRGNLLNEARSNGTPLQTNAARIWRYVGGGDVAARDGSRYLLRVYGTEQNYRQSFSAIAAGRVSERLTNLQRVPTQQNGGTAQWARSFRGVTVVAGGDVLDTRATDNETGVTSGVLKPTVTISARQRDAGLYGEVLWQPVKWSLALSGRWDRFRTFDARQLTAGGTAASLPVTTEDVFDPRLGVVRDLGRYVSLTASTFRAFRGPSQNELYRTGQVGSQTTLPNPSLRSERATGFETGGLVKAGRFGSVRGGYFWTQVNRPVAAVTVSTTATTSTLRRQNLGQLTSKGLTAEWEARPFRPVTVTGGYQYAVSTVTKYQVDATLVGKWTPQVPRNSASLQVKVEQARLGVMSVAVRTSGQQFDDSSNAFRLDGYALVDLYGEHAVGRHLRVYGSAQNLFNATVQAGRTPTLTLGPPRVVMAGIRLR